MLNRIRCNDPMLRPIVSLLVSTWLVTGYWVPASAQSNMGLEQQVEAVSVRLEGVMDTAAQALANPQAPNVRMTTCRIALVADSIRPSNSIFLYQEQALHQNLSKPYRQRFLQLSPSPVSGTVRSRSFRPTNPVKWAGFCDKPSSERLIYRSDLGSPACSVFLRQSGDNFVGNTPVDGCPANVRGAVRITNHIVLHKSGMDTWDRGFDAQGNQVWGAKTESYQFRRQQEP